MSCSRYDKHGWHEISDQGMDVLHQSAFCTCGTIGVGAWPWMPFSEEALAHRSREQQAERQRQDSGSKPRASRGSAPAEVSWRRPERSSAASQPRPHPAAPSPPAHARPCNSPITQWRMSRCCEILFFFVLFFLNVLVWIHCNVIYSLLNVVIRYLWIYGCDFRQKRK